MYARVTVAQVRPGELDETMSLLRESLYPALKQMKGFKSAFLLTNPNTEKIIAVALWEAEADIPHIGPPYRDATVEAKDPKALTRRFFEASPLERLAMIPLVGQAARESYQVALRVEIASAEEPTYASVVTGHARPGKIDETIGIAQDYMVPILKQQKGFKSYLGLIQSNTDKELEIIFWELEADQRAWESDSSYQELAAKLTPLKASPPTVEGYEVSVQV